PRFLFDGDPLLTIPMAPAFDQFGDQVVPIQAYAVDYQAAFSIFDTGASAVTIGYLDRFDTIPVKVPGGAIAEGIGGFIFGDVSEPDTILADGLHAAELTFDEFGFPLFEITFSASTAPTPGIQVFLVTQPGSPLLPTL